MAKKDLNNYKDDEDIIIKNQMEKMVNSYDLYMKRITLGREDALRKMTVNLAQVKQGDCVLEVGCATGTLSLAAKRQAGPTGSVFGIDIIPGMIEVSQKKAAQAKLDVIFQLGSIDNIPFPNDNFDVVMCSFMIFHMSEKVRNKGIDRNLSCSQATRKTFSTRSCFTSKSCVRRDIEVSLRIYVKA